VTDIISIPADQFENTTTKTSVLIFHNNGKTENIRFSELEVIKNDKNVFKFNPSILRKELVETKDIIINVNEKLLTNATYEEISKMTMEYNKNGEPIFTRNFSLNYKDYLPQEKLDIQDGFEMKPLENIVKFEKKSKRLASEGKTNGLYRFYTSSDKVKRIDNVDYQGNDYLIIGTGGNFSIFYDNNFSCSTHNFICSSENRLISSYIYYFLSYHFKTFTQALSRGTTIKNIGVKNILKYKIPIPTEEILNTILKPHLDNLYHLHTTLKDNRELLPMKEQEICNMIEQITTNEECEAVKITEICTFLKGKKRNITEGNIVGKYPLFSSSLTIDNWIDTYDYDIESIIFNTINGSGHFNVHYCKQFCATSNTLILNTNYINMKYLYYFTMLKIYDICLLANGSTKKKLGKNNLIKFYVKIPKNKQIIEDLQPYFTEIDLLQQNIQTLEKEEKEAINELMKCIIR